MPTHADKSQLTARQAADLSALADGSLDPSRRAEVQAWIEASPERAALYESERRVVELLHDARASERAPERLRARVQADRTSRQPVARRRTIYSGALAALAAVALALVLILPAGAPSFLQAAAVGIRGPVQAAPTPDPQAPGARLGRDVEDVYFPNWSSTGWRAVGQRTDTVDGRKLVTVYYQWHGRRIAYTIVGAPVLGQPSARVSYLNGVQLRTLGLQGRLVVTWRRAGHTCVLSGQGVSAAVLQALAAGTPNTSS